MILLEKTNGFLFATEYKYKQLIEKISNKNNIITFITSRVVAAALSVFALITTVYDLFCMTAHTILAFGYSVTHLKSPLKYCSTTRNIVVVIVEFVRHFLGKLFGSIVGIISPTHAARWFLPPNQVSMETRKENMTPEQATKLYEMTGMVHDLFEEEGISYCMTGGTQLGSTRHGGIIPWDDDVDLFFLDKQKEQIENLKEKLFQKGIGMIPCHLGFKFFDLNGKEVKEKDLEYKYPFIDICEAKLDSNDRITYVDEHFRQNYAGEYLLKTEWDNRELQKFGPLQLYGAPSPEKFCKRMYGENVFQYGYQLLNHRTFKIEIPKKYYLEKQDDGKCKSVEISPIIV